MYNIISFSRRAKMINIRVSEEKDKKRIVDLLNQEGIRDINLNYKNLNNSMVVCDGGEVIGYTDYNEIEDESTGVIETLIIKKEFQGQNIGDGLIKALLNLADKRRIKKVYVGANNKNSLFLEKVGLTKRKLHVSEGVVKHILKGKESRKQEDIEVFEAILPDFFNGACKGRG